MPSIIDSLVVLLELDPTQFSAAQKEAAAEFAKTKDHFKKNATQIEDSGKKAADAIGTMGRSALQLFAVLSATSSIKDFVAQTTAAGVALGNLSANLQASPRDMSALGLAVERVGGTADEATASFQKLAEARTRAEKTGETPAFQRYLNLLAAGGTGKQISLRGQSTMAFLTELSENAEIVARKQGQRVAFEYLKGITGSESVSTLLLKGKAGFLKSIGETSPLAISQRDIDAANKNWEIWKKINQEVVAFARNLLTTATLLDWSKVSTKEGGTDMGFIMGRPSGTAGAAQKGPLDWLQELFGIKPAGSQELSARAYLGHGPGRTPAGLADWRWHQEHDLGRVPGAFGSSMGGLRGGSADAYQSEKAMVQSIEQFTAVVRLLVQALLGVLAGSAAAGIGAAGVSGPASAPPTIWNRIKTAAGNAAATVFGSTPAQGAELGTLDSLSAAQREKMLDAITKTENARAGSNNPGNLMYADWQKQFGGQPGASGFAQFPDPASGRAAMSELLFGSKHAYHGMTIGAAMAKYAPRGHGRNDPAAYARIVGNAVGARPGGPVGAQSGAADDMNALADQTENSAAVREYLRTGGVGMDPHLLAWCAGFVNAALAHKGIKGTGSLMAGSFANWGHAVAPNDIQKGDVAEYRNGAHVGLIQSGRIVYQNGVPGVEIVAGNEFYSRAGRGPGRSQVGKVGHHWMPLSALNIRRTNQTPASDPSFDIEGADKRVKAFHDKYGRYPWDPSPDEDRLSRARGFMGLSASARRAAAASGHRVSTSSAETHIGMMHVHSAAPDAAGIADDIRSAIRRSSLATQANYGPA